MAHTTHTWDVDTGDSHRQNGDGRGHVYGVLAQIDEVRKFPPETLYSMPPSVQALLRQSHVLQIRSLEMLSQSMESSAKWAHRRWKSERLRIRSQALCGELWQNTEAWMA